MYQKFADGWIETISGCMFAGKTEELLRRIRILEYARKEIMIFKPAIDNRYSNTDVVSHDGTHLESHIVNDAKEILKAVKDSTQVVAIDEAQFFGDNLCDVANILADRGIRVMAAGLDTDFRGEPFGPMPQLMAQAEFVTKLTAACCVCGAPATRTQRIVDGKPAKYKSPVILVGASESYEARCRQCHEVPGKPKLEVR